MSIESITYAVPRVKHTAKEIAEACGGEEAFIAGKVGLHQRFVLDVDQTGVDLSTDACNSLLETNPALQDAVDLVVCVTQTPDQRIPHNSPQIAERLNLPTSTASFDISLGCSGYVYAVNIVEGFLDRCGLNNAILVTCDPYSRIISADDKDTNSIFGDAATATWIKRGAGRSETLACVFGTDGGAGDAIEIVAGGARQPFVGIMQADRTQGIARDDVRLHMRGRAVFNFVQARIPQSISDCLGKANLSIDDIDQFALHQGSTYMLDALARRARIPADKLLKNMKLYGNTVSSSIPMLLADLDSASQLSGSTVLLSGFGVGLSWGTMIMRFGDRSAVGERT